MPSKFGSEKCHGAEQSSLRCVEKVEKTEQYDSYEVFEILDPVDICEIVDLKKTTEMKKTLDEKISFFGGRKKQIKPSVKKCDPLRRLRELKQTKQTFISSKWDSR